MLWCFIAERKIQNPEEVSVPVSYVARAIGSDSWLPVTKDHQGCVVLVYLLIQGMFYLINGSVTILDNGDTSINRTKILFIGSLHFSDLFYHKSGT